MSWKEFPETPREHADKWEQPILSIGCEDCWGFGWYYTSSDDGSKALLRYCNHPRLKKTGKPAV